MESIFGDKYIVIDNDHVDLAPFWNGIYEKDLSNLKNQKESKTNKLTHDFITDALSFMDSEHDKNVLRAVLASFLSYDELFSLGIRPDVAKKRLAQLTDVSQELKNSEVAARDMIELRLNAKIESVEHQQKLLKAKASENLSEARKKDLTDKKQVLEDLLIYMT